MRRTLLATLAAWLFLVPCLTAGEKIYRGRWEGTPIEIRLDINERKHTVTGLVYKPGFPDNIIASMTGKRLDDGSLEVRLTYRFEDFGTFILKPATPDSPQQWQTSGKDLWFGLSD